MIAGVKMDDILTTDAENIAFAVNQEGINDKGFAGLVTRKYWRELRYCGPQKLGTVLSKQVGGITFHALVCYSLYKGWGEDQAFIIKKCFDSIPSGTEPIAAIDIGNGYIGQISNADFDEIHLGMKYSKKPITIYYYNDIKKRNHTFDEPKQKTYRKRK